MQQEKDKALDPSALPQQEVFEQKEIFQHKQPADTGKPLEDETINVSGSHMKESTKTSKEEGLNESNSEGNAGAFEGFEDQEKDNA